jgi:hypothetical protein
MPRRVSDEDWGIGVELLFFNRESVGLLGRSIAQAWEAVVRMTGRPKGAFSITFS